MHHAKQVKLLRELLEHVSTGSTAQTGTPREEPATAYVSAEVLAREKARIFAAEPLVGALSAELAEPGDYIAEEAMGLPYILLRGRDGRVRAFLNACRHRGTRLVDEGHGRRRRLTCPFHAWTYDDQGALAGVPRAESFGAVDHDGLSLVQLPAAEKHGIVWVRLHPGAPIEPDVQLAGLGDEIAAWRLDTKHVIQTQTLPRRMNWKLANDTFGETYHFAILHRNTLSATYHSDVTAYETFGRNHRMVFAARSIHELRNQPTDSWQLRSHATIAYFLFPHTQLLIGPGSVAVYRLLPDPERPDRCVVRQSLFLDGELAGAERESARQRTLKVHEEVIVNEDFAVAESAQSGLSSGLMRQVVFGRNEPALHHYHATFRAALASTGAE